MLETIWQYVLHTPWWVYVLFFYLLFVGIKAIKPRTLPLGKLFIIPALFFVWGVSGILEVAGFSLVHFFWWLLGLLIIATLAYLRTRRLAVIVDRSKKTLQIPGTYTTLIVILIIFASKYYFAAQLGANPNLAHDMTFIVVDLLVSGGVTGWFIGNLVGYLQKYNAK